MNKKNYLEIRTFPLKNILATVAIFSVTFLAFNNFVPAQASTTSTWTQEITAGTLTIDIANAASSYATVTTPTITMGSQTFDFLCQTDATGTFGTEAESIYVSNPNAATVWTASIAASSASDLWDSAGTDFDFNEAEGGDSGCTDDGATTDGDAFGGQMEVDPTTSGVITAGSCSVCDNTTGMAKGAAAKFVEDTNNDITLFTSDGTQTLGDWDLRGVIINQSIPLEQPVASDYTIQMVVSIVAA